MIIENLARALLNHLWQSTAVALLAWPIAIVMRKNRARIRYWVWLAASLKFLVPFSLLISAGGPIDVLVIDRVEQPSPN
jgi:bla regulator protein BlaR1